MSIRSCLVDAQPADGNINRSQYAYERKEAIQKTIMSMTLGKDVSALFPDVLKNIATQDLDQKKLVYLYLMYGDLFSRVEGQTC
jgi:vesicle coat complex subunit